MSTDPGHVPLRLTAPDHEPLPFVRPAAPPLFQRDVPRRKRNLESAGIAAALVAFGAFAAALSFVGTHPLQEGRSTAVHAR